MSAKHSVAVLIEDLTDPDLIPQRAWIDEHQGVIRALAVISGRVCRIDTKETMLAAGIAVCEPIGGDPASDWPMGVRVRIEDNHFDQVMWNCTARPEIVAAARRYMTLLAAGRAVPGTDLLAE